ncbi:hypothetical protein [Spirosoma pomorum]
MLFVIDACSIINILLIDEDEFLFKRLKSLDIKITPKVYSEIKTNLRKVVKGSFKEYDKKLTELLTFTFVYKDYMLKEEEDVISLYEEEFKKYTSYTKMNGEFCSTICSSVLSRSYKSKVVFFTDDYKAKKDFINFFSFHQIGYIEDSVDLLIFLFSNDSSFKKITLLNFLSNLRSRYLSDHVNLIDRLRNRYNDLMLKDKEEKHVISNLIKNLNDMNLLNVRKLFEGLDQKKDVFRLMNEYDSLFEIDNAYVDKIIGYETHFRGSSVFALYD